MRKLLMAAEFGVAETERRLRFEFLQEGHYTFGEWTSHHLGAQWRNAWKADGQYDLKDGLAAFDYFVFEDAVENPEVYLRGVAICTGVPALTKKLLMKQAHETISNCWEFNANFDDVNFPVLHHAFFGTFYKRLHRHAIGDGCWAVQFNGLRACNCCEFDQSEQCLGKEIVQTAKNNVGFEIPVLNKSIILWK